MSEALRSTKSGGSEVEMLALGPQIRPVAVSTIVQKILHCVSDRFASTMIKRTKVDLSGEVDDWLTKRYSGPSHFACTLMEESKRHGTTT